jgi:hypothetical protein
MILALIGLFDQEMTKAICELKKGIVDQGVSDHTLSSNIGPHITFCGFEGRCDQKSRDNLGE